MVYPDIVASIVKKIIYEIGLGDYHMDCLEHGHVVLPE